MAEVYRDWTKKRITRTKCLDVFSICTGLSKTTDASTENLPSWAPDLRNVKDTDALLFSRSNGFSGNEEYDTPYAASGRTICFQASFDSTGSVLDLQGFRIGSVVEIFGFECSDNILDRMYEKFGTRVMDLERDIRQSYTKRSRELAEDPGSSASTFFRGLVSEVVSDNRPRHKQNPSRQSHSTESIFHAMFTDVLIRGDTRSLIHVDYKADGEEGECTSSLRTAYDVMVRRIRIPRYARASGREAFLSKFSSDLLIACHEMDFFLTSENRLGVIPRSFGVKEGYEICVLFGGNTPYVVRSLRNRRTDQQRWKLVGPCYLYGYMDGEAIAAYRRGALEPTTFEFF